MRIYNRRRGPLQVSADVCDVNIEPRARVQKRLLPLRDWRCSSLPRLEDFPKQHQQHVPHLMQLFADRRADAVSPTVLERSHSRKRRARRYWRRQCQRWPRFRQSFLRARVLSPPTLCTAVQSRCSWTNDECRILAVRILPTLSHTISA